MNTIRYAGVIQPSAAAFRGAIIGHFPAEAHIQNAHCEGAFNYVQEFDYMNTDGSGTEIRIQGGGRGGTVFHISDHSCTVFFYISNDGGRTTSEYTVVAIGTHSTITGNLGGVSQADRDKTYDIWWRSPVFPRQEPRITL